MHAAPEHLPRVAATPTSATTSSQLARAMQPALGKTVEERKRKHLPRRPDDPDHARPGHAEGRRSRRVTKKVPIGNDEQHRRRGLRLEPGTGKVLAMAQNTTLHRRHRSIGQDGRSTGRVDQRTAARAASSSGRRPRRSPSYRPGAGHADQATVNAKAAGAAQAAYKPSDFPGGCEAGHRRGTSATTSRLGGQMSLMKATALSINTAFVALAAAARWLQVRDTDDRLGLHQSDGQPIEQVRPAVHLSGLRRSPRNGRRPTPRSPPTARMLDDARRSPGHRRAARRCRAKTKCTQVVDPDVAHGADKFLSKVTDQRLRHPQPARRATARRPARPVRPTRTTSRGSSATPRSWPRPSGSARPTTRHA